MKVGIFGGTFDPPHIAHSVISEIVRCQFGLDQILWVPSYAPPHKSLQHLTPYRDRYQMVRAATEGQDYFEVSDIEQTLQCPTYTVRMLDALEELHSDSQLYLIFGSDSLLQFDSWSHPELIVQKAKLLVYPRVGHTVTDKELPAYLRGCVQFVDAPTMSISSEYVRQRLYIGKTARYLVLDCVLNYILKHRLYSEINERSEDLTHYSS